MRSDSKPSRFYLWLTLAALLLSLVNLYMGRSEFGGYDLSTLIDIGWRVMNGQLPTLSFICTMPPSLYLLTEAAFRALGLNWRSLFLAESLLYLLLCFLGLRLCWLLQSGQDGDRERHLPLIYIAAQSLLLLSVNHIWHSTTASGFATYAILATYALIRNASARQAREATMHVGFAFAILLLSKPNTAWVAMLLCTLCLARVRRLWIPALQAIAAAIVADLLLLTACHVSLFNAFSGYLGLGGRALPRLFLVGFRPEPSRRGEMTLLLTYLPLVLPAWRMLQMGWRDRTRVGTSATDLLVASATLVSLIGLGTNWELKIVDIAPFLVGAAILAGTDPDRYRRLILPLLWSTGLLFAFATFLGADRIRMKGVGAWAGSAYGPMVTIQDRFFGDFRTRQSFAELLSEVDLVTAHSAGQRIFFGPRMEFLYARDRLASPTHLPVWWHPGSSYPLSLEPKVDKTWEGDNFDVLVFAKKDRTRFPSDLLKFIDVNYTEDTSMTTIDVFYRKQEPPYRDESSR